MKRPPSRSHLQVRALATGLLLAAGVLCHAQVHAQGKADKAIELISEHRGKPLEFKDFFVNDAATQVGAATLAGVPAGAVNIAESVNDVAVFLQGLDSKNQGAGFSIAPARIRKPWPRIEVKDYLERDTSALLLANLSLSYAQGRHEVQAKQVLRRAVSIGTGGVFSAADDPIQVVADSVVLCADDERTALAKLVAEKGSVTDADKAALKGALTTCIDGGLKKLDQRWFRPLWSVMLGTGDVRTDAAGSQTVRLGHALALAARYGRGIKPPPGSTATDEFLWGWSVAGSYTLRRNEPVLATLDAAQPDRVDTHVAAVKVSVGTDVWRGVGEFSNVREKQASTGDRTLRHAVGLDYKFGEGWWLNFRYGQRQKAGASGQESASLLSLTISPSTLF